MTNITYHHTNQEGEEQLVCHQCHHSGKTVPVGNLVCIYLEVSTETKYTVIMSQSLVVQKIVSFRKLLINQPLSLTVHTKSIEVIFFVRKLRGAFAMHRKSQKIPFKTIKLMI